jgi:cell division septation protein DedD
MQKSEKYFIFTWKELTVIALLMAITLGFFFTLGLHYGKKIPDGGSLSETTHGDGGNDGGGKLEEGPEVVPPREALEQGAQHSGGATEESIREATQAEIEAAKVKLESPKQVDLPSDKPSAKPSEKQSEKSEAHKPPTAPSPAAAKFAIQLGSYPSKKEAQQKIRLLSKKSVPAEFRQVEVNGQTRFRVIIPGFTKKGQAEAEARALIQASKIGTYIVIKSE